MKKHKRKCIGLHREAIPIMWIEEYSTEIASGDGLTRRIWPQWAVEGERELRLERKRKELKKMLLRSLLIADSCSHDYAQGWYSGDCKHLRTVCSDCGKIWFDEESGLNRV